MILLAAANKPGFDFVFDCGQDRADAWLGNYRLGRPAGPMTMMMRKARQVAVVRHVVVSDDLVVFVVKQLKRVALKLWGVKKSQPDIDLDAAAASHAE